METKVPANSAESGATNVGGRRRRRNGSDPNLRYFLPKPGASPAKPEFGQQMASEGEALIEGFKRGQRCYTLTAWKAIPEANGVESPLSMETAGVQEAHQ